jgi:mono/diheme cytochrome c family protein
MAHATHRLRVAVILAGLVAVWPGQPIAAQHENEEHPSFLLASPYGVDNFHAYCSPCHGRDGKGNGPVARALKTAPPDLTTIIARNHGVFPRGTIRGIIANGSPDIPAHGSGKMPIWGPTFHALDSSDRAAEMRLANIVEYLSSIQQW